MVLEMDETRNGHRKPSEIPYDIKRVLGFVFFVLALGLFAVYISPHRLPIDYVSGISRPYFMLFLKILIEMSQIETK